jgi:hypothetical protein
MDLKTVVDLKNFLDSHDEESIEPWLNESWEGKDKLESLLRIFASYNLFPQFKNYTLCCGNFNNKTLNKQTSIKQAFVYNGKNICLKDKGDASDLSFVSKTNDKHLLLTTSKNLSKMNINNLDIEKILAIFTEYSDYTMSLCICVRNKQDLYNMVVRSEKSNQLLKNWINKEDTIILDYDDIDRAYKLYKKTCNNIDIKEFNCDKTILIPKPHQKMLAAKIIKLTSEEVREIMLAAIQRSGKSYVICGIIIDFSKNKNNCNYLIISTAPNETMEPQKNVCDCFQLRDFNIVIVNGVNKNPPLSNKNIILCSEHFLRNKVNNSNVIEWMANMNFDIIFIDECHNGATTPLAKEVLDIYGNNAITIYVTATYYKPVNTFNIPNDHIILWNLEDISLCKNISSENIDILAAKHGIEFTKCFGDMNEKDIMKEYCDYPALHILTNKLDSDTEQKVINETINNNYGWSTEACLCLNESKIKFQNEDEVIKLIHKVFGKRSSLGIPCDDYPEDIVFVDRIKKICEQNNSRHIDNMSEPIIIMAFLPPIHIDETSNALITLIKNKHLIDDYVITYINGKITNDPLKRINDAHTRAKNEGKKGVLVLSGKQCSLGVTIPSCDIVLLLHNGKSFDSNQQMIFRGMSPAPNKKCGFVIDLNIHRCINMMISNAMQIKSGHPKKSIKYLLETKIINFNADHWQPSFGNDISSIDKFCDDIYNIYTSDLSKTVKDCIANIRNSKIFVDEEDHHIFENMINDDKNKKIKKIVIIKHTTKIKNGIQSLQCTNDEEDNVITSIDNRINYTEFIAMIAPLICFLTLTINETDFKEMLIIVHNDKYLNNILQSQLNTWWNKGTKNFIKQIILSYDKYMSNDQNTKHSIRIIKELFEQSSNQSNELGKLVDEYLIPQQSEKVNHAEVSTPYFLREEMIDKIPNNVWSKKMKSGNYKYPTIFEPCAGKGGFLLTIINKLMEKMEPSIPDKNKRYKHIVEKCLYFADINPLNIFICKQLINPNKEYKLNYYEGNTLEMDINETWKINGFDIIIGNPPYNSSGNLNSGNTIWQEFVNKSLKNWLNQNGHLCFVHPPGWRKPCDNKSQMKGFYDLMCKKNNMLYLSMHDIADGKKTFKCGTKYDWYVIKNTNVHDITEIKDYNGVMHNIETHTWNWLPNYNFNSVDKMLAKNGDNKLKVIMNSTYHATRDYVEDEETDEFCYPLIHSTPAKGIRYKYTNDDTKGVVKNTHHFGISKLIFGEAGINHVIEDIDGEYGMTQGAIALVPNNINDFPAIKQVLLSTDFAEILKACSWANFRIDAKLFALMKEDFWKYLNNDILTMSSKDQLKHMKNVYNESIKEYERITKNVNHKCPLLI